MRNVSFRNAAAAICVTAAALLPGVAHAGAGAVFKVCIMITGRGHVAPTVVHFTPSSDKCMHDMGHEADLFVRSGALTCTDIGYIESDGSGGCNYDPSYWSLSYVNPAPGITPMSGRVKLDQKVVGPDRRGNTDQANYVHSSGVGDSRISVGLSPGDDGGTHCANKDDKCGDVARWPSSTQGPIYIVIKYDQSFWNGQHH